MVAAGVAAGNMTGTALHDENNDNRDDDLLAKLLQAKVEADATGPKRHGKESAEEEKGHLFEMETTGQEGDDRSRSGHD